MPDMLNTQIEVGTIALYRGRPVKIHSNRGGQFWFTTETGMALPASRQDLETAEELREELRLLNAAQDAERFEVRDNPDHVFIPGEENECAVCARCSCGWNLKVGYDGLVRLGGGGYQEALAMLRARHWAHVVVRQEQEEAS